MPIPQLVQRTNMDSIAIQVLLRRACRVHKDGKRQAVIGPRAHVLFVVETAQAIAIIDLFKIDSDDLLNKRPNQNRTEPELPLDLLRCEIYKHSSRATNFCQKPKLHTRDPAESTSER